MPKKRLTPAEAVEFIHRHQRSVVNQREVGNDVPSFAEAIKRALRQDPDVILVGEIRDLEVGEVAIQAALTGHLVFSTLHTNDASSAITRLVDMGIKPFLVASSIQAIMAQRLVRERMTLFLGYDEVVSHAPEWVSDSRALFFKFRLVGAL